MLVFKDGAQTHLLNKTLNNTQVFFNQVNKLPRKKTVNKVHKHVLACSLLLFKIKLLLCQACVGTEHNVCEMTSFFDQLLVLQGQITSDFIGQITFANVFRYKILSQSRFINNCSFF